jgi:hypothetical protein
MDLRDPSCPYGYTSDDLRAILGDRMETFWRWMTGQTMSLCDGSAYDHDREGYYSTECSSMLPGMPLKKEEIKGLGGHGPVVYRWDLERFLTNMPVFDW